MKRLLVLMVVFAMTSAASAGYVEVLINGEAATGNEVGASDIVSLKLVDDRGSQFLVGTLSLSNIDVSLGDNASHTFFQAGTPSGWSINPVDRGYTSSGNGVWFNAFVPADGVIFTHEFHVPDDAQFSDEILVDWNIGYQFLDPKGGSLVLHVTPEPMTIGLLGLGALGLLRRRRKA